MNRTWNRNLNLTGTILAAALTVSTALAQQPTVAYINGQPFLVTPLQNNMVAGQPVVNGYAQAPQMMPAYVAPQAPVQSSPYGAFPQYVGAGAGVMGSQPRRISVPTGAPVYVRLISSISSDRLVPGAPFEASLDAPLEVNGMVVAERGARVEGRVSESDAAGKISGQSRLALQLTRIMTADGKTLDIQTNTISLNGGTSYGKDVARIAGLAGVGAALGAINSGRGAAIGSAAGAAAGIGWVLNSKGKGTTIPSETRLEFHLIAPATFTTW